VAIAVGQQSRLGLLEQGDVAIVTIDVSVGAVAAVDDLAARRDVGLLRRVIDALAVLGVARVAAVDVGLEPGALARVRLADLLVAPQGRPKLILGHVVDEPAAAERVGHGQAQQAVARLEDGGGALVQDLVVELRVVDAEARAGEEVQQPAVLVGREEAALHGQGGRVRHVNRDGVAVSQRRLGY
jgi:hypothetical protein